MKESLIKQPSDWRCIYPCFLNGSAGGSPSAERIQNERACCTPHCHGRGHDCRRRGLCARGDLSAHADHDDGNALARVYRARDGACGAAVRRARGRGGTPPHDALCHPCGGGDVCPVLRADGACPRAAPAPSGRHPACTCGRHARLSPRKGGGRPAHPPALRHQSVCDGSCRHAAGDG